MANVNVSIDQLAGEIVMAVQQYTEDVAVAIEKELDKTSKAVLDDIKKSSAYKDRSGRYRKGWRRKKKSSSGITRYIIHNKDKPWLVHLLEFGHAKRGGGRVAGKPHMRPAYDNHVPAMEARIEQIIKKGG